MDIEQTVDRLRQLGCTAEQVQRHLSARPQPKQPKQQEQRQRPPTFHLTQDQIDALLPKLRARQWRWTMWPNNAQADWVGHAILSVPGVPNLKFDDMGFIVGDVLAQLKALGHIQRVRISVERETSLLNRSHGTCRVPSVYWVEVISQPVRRHRERLDEPRHRERLDEPPHRHRERLDPLPADSWADILIPILNEARAELRNPNPDDRVPRNRPRLRLQDAALPQSVAQSGFASPGHTDMPEHVLASQRPTSAALRP
jgi:hypothetical protein